MANAFPLQSIFPQMPSGNPGYTNFVLNATTDKVEFILQAPEAITITTVAFRYGARTGTPPTYQLSLQGVDASGNSDGTDLGGGSPTLVTFTPPADATWDGTTQTVTLTNAYTIARGAFFAIVIDYNTGTVNAGNNSSFTTDYTSAYQQFPYVIQNDAGSRTRRNSIPVIAYLSASKCYGYAAFGSSNASIHDGSTPDEAGLIFTLPAEWGYTYQIVGVNTGIRFGTAGQTVRMRLYDSDGSTVLQTIDIDSDNTRAASVSGCFAEYYFDEATLSTLNFGSTYRITFTVTAASGGVIIPYYTLPSSTYLTSFPLSDNAYWTQRTDAGAWTDTNTRRPWIALIFDDWTEPSGGGIGSLIGGGLIV